jgi:hypothetical protein
MTHETCTIPEALAFAAKCRAQANELRVAADACDQMAETWDSAIRVFGVGSNVVSLAEGRMWAAGSAGR